MQNRDRIEHQGVVKTVLNIVITSLCCLTLIMGCLAIKSFCDSGSYRYREKDMYYRVKDSDFARLVEIYHTNVQAGHRGNREEKKYYGVAKYYEAASYYRAYMEAGDTARAERELVKMEAALEEMGEFAILEEAIKEQLGYQAAGVGG